jgi:uncharacterized membrane protein
MAITEDTASNLERVRGFLSASEPAIVLLGYMLLCVLVLLPGGSFLRAALAITLNLFGCGYSLATVLFNRTFVLDWAERLAMAACLSLAFGGFSGFLLALSPWGLRLVPFLVVVVVANLGCYALIWHRRRGQYEYNRLSQRFDLSTLTNWWADQGWPGQIVSITLTVALISGGVALYQAVLKPSSRPPLTEFFLLDERGQIESYPETALAGEPLAITYGIANQEQAPALYQVYGLIDHRLVGSSQPVQLEPGELLEAPIAIAFPEDVGGMTKVEFVLTQQGRRYRTLHLWFEVEQALQ